MCTECMLQPLLFNVMWLRLQVKCHMTIFCVRLIIFKSFEGFLNNSPQMLTIVRQCAERMLQPLWLKVKVSVLQSFKNATGKTYVFAKKITIKLKYVKIFSLFCRGNYLHIYPSYLKYNEVFAREVRYATPLVFCYLVKTSNVVVCIHV